MTCFYNQDQTGARKSFLLYKLSTWLELVNVVNHQHVFSLVEEYGLCQKLCDLYNSEGACFHYQIQQCKGACIQEEKAEDYNARLEDAIKNYQFKHHSFFIIDRGRNDEEKSVVKIENGKYIGFGYIPQNKLSKDAEILSNAIDEYPDNKDVQQIIRSHLRHHPVEAIIKY